MQPADEQMSGGAKRLLCGNDTNYLSKDDAFPYECKNCGECCRFYHNIRLTPLDIYKLARHLSIDIKDFINDYCKVNIESEILPVVEFKTIGGNSFCPLYINSRCSVHAAKPASCALYPLARIIDISTGTPLYFAQPHECDANAESQSVLDWLARYNLIDDEAFLSEWHGFLTDTMAAIKRMGALTAICVGTATIHLHSLILTLIYHQYNDDGDFLLQFRDNCEALTDMLAVVSELSGI